MSVVKRAFLLLLVPVGYFYFLSVVLNLFIADMYFASAKYKLENGEIENSLKEINKSISSNSNEPQYFRQKIKILDAKRILVKEAEIEKIEGSILSLLLESESKNPKNLATLRNIIPLYYFWIGKEGTDEEITNPNREEKIKVARVYFLKLKNTYYNDLGILVDVATYEKKLGLMQDYELTKAMATNLRPDVIEWHESFR